MQNNVLSLKCDSGIPLHCRTEFSIHFLMQQDTKIKSCRHEPITIDISKMLTIHWALSSKLLSPVAALCGAIQLLRHFFLNFQYYYSLEPLQERKKYHYGIKFWKLTQLHNIQWNRRNATVCQRYSITCNSWEPHIFITRLICYHLLVCCTNN
jgi:hypothetical protein